MIKPGDIFKLTYIPYTVKLIRVIDRESGKKLLEPYYEWVCLEDGEKFRNKLKDIQKEIRFEKWVKN